MTQRFHLLSSSSYTGLVNTLNQVLSGTAARVIHITTQGSEYIAIIDYEPQAVIPLEMIFTQESQDDDGNNTNTVLSA